MLIPPPLQERLRALLGEEAEALQLALDSPPCRALRFNPQRITREELEEELEGGLGDPIPFFPHSHRFEHPSVGRLLCHLGGAVYVQEPAAMAPVAALEQTKVHSILDLCAAPGGKSLQAATLLEENGFLVCNEPSPERRRALMQNLERMGERRCLVSAADATKSIPAEWKGAFDLVLCDAPCSGEGMLRKSQEAAEMWSYENVLLCARRQEKILDNAFFACAPGGRILYSTCTWSQEENEEQVLRMLRKYPELSLLPPRREVAAVAKRGISLQGTDLSLCLRFYPHLFPGEGQFLAVLQKAGGPAPQQEEKKKSKKKANDPKPSPQQFLARRFLEETLSELPKERLFIRGETVYLAPHHPFSEEPFVSSGVPVGTVQKGRILPHHRFFIAYAPLFSRRISLSPKDPRVEAYLRGEEIALEGYEKGWSLLEAGRIPLGGVRVVDGRGKNAYPKGLRRNGG